MPFVFAALELSTILPLVIGLVGLAGVIFTALKYNRDDTTSVIGQQDTILNEMKTLNDELRTTTSELRTERDGLREQVAELTTQVEKLRGTET
jgi:hypothetical protein